jgi:hypothetical protein
MFNIRKRGGANMKDSISKLTIKDMLKENDHHKDELIKLFIDKGIISKDTYKNYHNKEEKK